MGDLSENQKKYLVEIFKRWGMNPILDDNELKIRISKDEVDGLIEQGYLCNIKYTEKGIKFNLSINGQKIASDLLK